MSKNPPRHPMKGRKKPCPPGEHDYRGGLVCKKCGCRMDPGEYLDRNPARPPTENLARAAKHEQSLVDEETQGWITKDAHHRFNTERAEEMRKRQGRVMEAKLRALHREGAQAGVEIAPKFAVFVREIQSEIAAAKRKAA